MIVLVIMLFCITSSIPSAFAVLSTPCQNGFHAPDGINCVPFGKCPPNYHRVPVRPVGEKGEPAYTCVPLLQVCPAGKMSDFDGNCVTPDCKYVPKWCQDGGIVSCKKIHMRCGSQEQCSDGILNVVKKMDSELRECPAGKVCVYSGKEGASCKQNIILTCENYKVQIEKAKMLDILRQQAEKNLDKNVLKEIGSRLSGNTNLAAWQDYLSQTEKSREAAIAAEAMQSALRDELVYETYPSQQEEFLKNINRCSPLLAKYLKDQMEQEKEKKKLKRELSNAREKEEKAYDVLQKEYLKTKKQMEELDKEQDPLKIKTVSEEVKALQEKLQQLAAAMEQKKERISALAGFEFDKMSVEEKKQRIADLLKSNTDLNSKLLEGGDLSLAFKKSLVEDVLATVQSRQKHPELISTSGEQIAKQITAFDNKINELKANLAKTTDETKKAALQIELLAHIDERYRSFHDRKETTISDIQDKNSPSAKDALHVLLTQEGVDSRVLAREVNRDLLQDYLARESGGDVSTKTRWLLGEFDARIEDVNRNYEQAKAQQQALQFGLKIAETLGFKPSDVLKGISQDVLDAACESHGRSKEQCGQISVLLSKAKVEGDPQFMKLEDMQYERRGLMKGSIEELGSAQSLAIIMAGGFAGHLAKLGGAALAGRSASVLLGMAGEGAGIYSRVGFLTNPAVRNMILSSARFGAGLVSEGAVFDITTKVLEGKAHEISLGSMAHSIAFMGGSAIFSRVTNPFRAPSLGKAIGGLFAGGLTADVVTGHLTVREIRENPNMLLDRLAESAATAAVFHGFHPFSDRLTKGITDAVERKAALFDPNIKQLAEVREKLLKEPGIKPTDSRLLEVTNALHNEVTKRGEEAHRAGRIDDTTYNRYKSEVDLAKADLNVQRAQARFEQAAERYEKTSGGEKEQTGKELLAAQENLQNAHTELNRVTTEQTRKKLDSAARQIPEVNANRALYEDVVREQERLNTARASEQEAYRRMAENPQEGMNARVKATRETLDAQKRLLELTAQLERQRIEEIQRTYDVLASNKNLFSKAERSALEKQGELLEQQRTALEASLKGKQKYLDFQDAVARKDEAAQRVRERIAQGEKPTVREAPLEKQLHNLEKEIRDAKAKLYTFQKENGIISEKEYNRRINALEEESKTQEKNGGNKERQKETRQDVADKLEAVAKRMDAFFEKPAFSGCSTCSIVISFAKGAVEKIKEAARAISENKPNAKELLAEAAKRAKATEDAYKNLPESEKQKPEYLDVIKEINNMRREIAQAQQFATSPKVASFLRRMGLIQSPVDMRILEMALTYSEAGTAFLLEGNKVQNLAAVYGADPAKLLRLLSRSYAIAPEYTRKLVNSEIADAEAFTSKRLKMQSDMAVTEQHLAEHLRPGDMVHGTSLNRLKTIKEKGLHPSETYEKQIAVAVQRWSKGMMLKDLTPRGYAQKAALRGSEHVKNSFDLKIPVQELDVPILLRVTPEYPEKPGPGAGPGEYWYGREIPAKYLEFYDPTAAGGKGKWISVSEYNTGIIIPEQIKGRFRSAWEERIAHVAEVEGKARLPEKIEKPASPQTSASTLQRVVESIREFFKNVFTGCAAGTCHLALEPAKQATGKLEQAENKLREGNHEEARKILEDALLDIKKAKDFLGPEEHLPSGELSDLSARLKNMERQAQRALEAVGGKETREGEKKQNIETILQEQGIRIEYDQEYDNLRERLEIDDTKLTSKEQDLKLVKKAIGVLFRFLSNPYLIDSFEVNEHAQRADWVGKMNTKYGPEFNDFNNRNVLRKNQLSVVYGYLEILRQTNPHLEESIRPLLKLILSKILGKSSEYDTKMDTPAKIAFVKDIKAKVSDLLKQISKPAKEREVVTSDRSVREKEVSS